MSVDPRQSAFPSTHWSEVRRAAWTGTFEERRQVLGSLLERYSQPLKAHLASHYRLGPDRLDDLFQSFLEQRIIMQELLAKADSARGRLRTFLLNALDNFVLNELRRDRARKRNPPGGHVALSEIPEGQEPSVPAPSRASLDAAWARAVLAEAVRRLKEQCAREGRTALWEVFDRRNLRPLLWDEAPQPYDELAAALGFKTPAQLYKALNTAKSLLRNALRSVVAEYAADDKDIERELEDWKAIFAQGGIDEGGSNV